VKNLFSISENIVPTTRKSNYFATFKKNQTKKKYTLKPPKLVKPPKLLVTSNSEVNFTAAKADKNEQPQQRINDHIYVKYVESDHDLTCLPDKHLTDQHVYDTHHAEG
jgi:hypothetical protein